MGAPFADANVWATNSRRRYFDDEPSARRSVARGAASRSARAICARRRGIERRRRPPCVPIARPLRHRASSTLVRNRPRCPFWRRLAERGGNAGSKSHLNRRVHEARSRRLQVTETDAFRLVIEGGDPARAGCRSPAPMAIACTTDARARRPCDCPCSRPSFDPVSRIRWLILRVRAKAGCIGSGDVPATEMTSARKLPVRRRSRKHPRRVMRFRQLPAAITPPASTVSRCGASRLPSPFHPPCVNGRLFVMATSASIGWNLPSPAA